MQAIRRAPDQALVEWAVGVARAMEAGIGGDSYQSADAEQATLGGLGECVQLIPLRWGDAVYIRREWKAVAALTAAVVPDSGCHYGRFELLAGDGELPHDAPLSWASWEVTLDSMVPATTAVCG